MPKLITDTTERFTFDGWARPEFTVRRDEADALLQLVKHKHRVYIDGPRRNGKTTLVLNTIREEANIPVLRIDLEGVESEEKMVERLATAVQSFIRESAQAQKRLLASKKTKTGFGVKLGGLEITHEKETGFDYRVIDRSIDGLLAAVFEVARITHAAVFVDEFQAVKSKAMKHPSEVMGSFSAISDPAATRGEVAFIFAGSNRHAMHQIFAGSEGLFFQRTQNLPLGPIPEAQILPFLSRRFGEAVPEDIGHEAYRWTEGITGDLQRLYSAMRHLRNTGKPLTPDVLNEAKTAVVEDLGRGFALTLQKADPEVLRMLDLLAQTDVRKVDELAKLLPNAGFTVDAANKALAVLLQLGVLHVRGTPQEIQRPEPILFHYLASHPAVAHRPFDSILADAACDIEKLTNGFRAPVLGGAPEVG